MEKLIDKEIKWCKENKGKSSNSNDFEDGFIKGLKQAKMLIEPTRALKLDEGEIEKELFDSEMFGGCYCKGNGITCDHCEAVILTAKAIEKYINNKGE